MYTAQANYVRMTPRKLRLVAGIMKKLSVNDAEAILLLQSRRAAQPLLKLLRSAVANAKNSGRVSPEQLFIASVLVNQGPMLKRYLPRARGSASPIQKKMSHVTLVLGEREEKVPGRFTIMTKKKVRLPDGTKKQKKETTTEKEHAHHESARKPERRGMFSKMFRRKAISEG